MVVARPSNQQETQKERKRLRRTVKAACVGSPGMTPAIRRHIFVRRVKLSSPQSAMARTLLPSAPSIGVPSERWAPTLMPGHAVCSDPRRLGRCKSSKLWISRISVITLYEFDQSIVFICNKTYYPVRPVDEEKEFDSFVYRLRVIFTA